MHVMHIALGGCLSAPPISYGLTEDTGGHIAYVLGAATAQARLRGVTEVTIVTRAFEMPNSGGRYARLHERVSEKCQIRRLRSPQAGYVCKEALEAELPALRAAFLDMLETCGRPDVIHAHFADAAQLAQAAAMRFGTPWLYSAHSLATEKLAFQKVAADPALLRRIDLEHRAMIDADAIVASSRDEAERQIPACAEAAEGKVHRIYPGVALTAASSPDRGRVLIAPFLRNPEKPVILTISRPIRKKNLVALVEAYAAAPDLQEAANLVIVAGLRDGLADGTDEQAQVMRALFDAVDRNDLWGKVALPRRHVPEDVPALYALAANGGVFCNPAHHEPFGLTLVEAARSGVPIVATRNGGPRDIVELIGYGALVDPSRPDRIAEGLRRVLSDTQRTARSNEARGRALRIFDWDRYAGRLLEVYAGLRSATPARQITRPTDLVACDIDGTLTGDAAGARDFSRWLERRPTGQIFAVATGRSISDARFTLADWGLDAPDTLITSVGSEIWRRTRGDTYRLCNAYAASIADGWDPKAVSLALAPFAPQPSHEQRAWKLSFFGTEDDAIAMRDMIASRDLAAQVIASHGRFIDVMPARAGKAAAIAFEAARLGLNPTDCVVAGDSGNDADMLGAFPRAIRPVNALSELDAVPGGYRSPLPCAAGVLDGLRHYGILAAETIAAE